MTTLCPFYRASRGITCAEGVGDGVRVAAVENVHALHVLERGDLRALAVLARKLQHERVVRGVGAQLELRHEPALVAHRGRVRALHVALHVDFACENTDTRDDEGPRNAAHTERDHTDESPLMKTEKVARIVTKCSQ